jgi:hypothetical protein
VPGQPPPVVVAPKAKKPADDVNGLY